MSRPTEAQLGWLAGIVDGEGTVGIHRSNGKRYKHPYLRPALQIVNTDLKIMEMARSILTSITGNSHNLVVTNRKRPENNKIGYRIKIGTQHELLLVMPMLLPYLVGKAEQAELVIEFCKRKYGRLKYSWYEFKEEDGLAYQRCLTLNRKGDQAQSADVIELKRSA